MNACVVYESMFGNTARLARAVARGWGGAGVLDVRVTVPTDLREMDLIVFGGPTHAFSMSRTATREDARRQGATYGDDGRGLRELLDELPDPLRTSVATFDSRIGKARRLPGSAARAAAKDLRRHHGARVVGQESFYVEGTDGPLLPGELERAEAWGAELHARLGTRSRGTDRTG